MVLTIPIPLEILIQIVEHLPLDSDADRLFLSRCSRLSRAFVTPCQSRLFSDIHFFSYKGASRCRRLHNVLTQSPHLASFIRTLVIQNGWTTQMEPKMQRVMWALTEPTLPQVLDLLPALQLLYLNSSTTKLLTWNDMGPALQTSLLRLFTLPSLTCIRLRNMKVPPTIFCSSSQLADLGLFRSEIDPPEYLKPSSTAPDPDRPRPHSLSITSEVAGAVLEHLSTALDISLLKELVLTDGDSGLDAVAHILELCRPSLVRFVWIFPKFSNFMTDQSAAEASPLTLSLGLQSLEISVWDWLNRRETMPPFIWVLHTLKALSSQPESPNLEEITLGITVDPFYHYYNLVRWEFWEDLDNLLTTGDVFGKLRRVTTAIYHPQPPDEKEVNDKWTNPMPLRLPRLASRGMLLVTNQKLPSVTGWKPQKLNSFTIR
ncbi:hypothetical protein FPV67DRAFT_1669069 [Lyophyllum atratum]|nr:hypothetical protein FPV67DRAFT_1669069 [Lyophyllum atratum]